MRTSLPKNRNSRVSLMLNSINTIPGNEEMDSKLETTCLFAGVATVGFGRACALPNPFPHCAMRRNVSFSTRCRELARQKSVVTCNCTKNDLKKGVYRSIAPSLPMTHYKFTTACLTVKHFLPTPLVCCTTREFGWSPCIH